MKENNSENRILKIVSIKLIDNNISFKYINNTINAEDYFNLSINSNKEIEIITKSYNKDFIFSSDNIVEHLLEVIDRIIFNY